MDRALLKRGDVASIPRGWVIAGLALAGWILLVGAFLVVYALVT